MLHFYVFSIFFSWDYLTQDFPIWFIFFKNLAFIFPAALSFLFLFAVFFYPEVVFFLLSTE